MTGDIMDGMRSEMLKERRNRLLSQSMEWFI